MTEQLQMWSGEFGKQYADRNPVDWREVVPFLQPIVEGLVLERVLEVGCNRGHNLVALREILGKTVPRPAPCSYTHPYKSLCAGRPPWVVGSG